VRVQLVPDGISLLTTVDQGPQNLHVYGRTINSVPLLKVGRKSVYFP